MRTGRYWLDSRHNQTATQGELLYTDYRQWWKQNLITSEKVEELKFSEKDGQFKSNWNPNEALPYRTICRKTCVCLQKKLKDSFPPVKRLTYSKQKQTNCSSITETKFKWPNKIYKKVWVYDRRSQICSHSSHLFTCTKIHKNFILRRLFKEVLSAKLIDGIEGKETFVSLVDKTKKCAWAGKV